MNKPKRVKKKLAFSEKLLTDSAEAMINAIHDLITVLYHERHFLREYRKHITTKEVNEQ